ncbi:MAG: helix-turn-helix domain-containing protein [Firmicutes bacterium]|nr:helix-turn-helix domain-containing protein [Bacillota bacterium]
MNILLIDDDVDVTDAMIGAIDFSSLGFTRVFTAADARTAREILRSETIDVMVTDIELPGQTGLQILEWVRDRQMNTIALFCTCYADFNYAKKAIELQCFDYFLKPISYDELSERLRQAGKEAEKRFYSTKKPEPVLPSHSRICLIRDVKAYIASHLSEDLSSPLIARHFFMNPDYLNRLFKEDEGITLHQYILDTRIALVKKQLTSTNLSINQIAQSVGYDNFSYFSQLFRKKTGLTPVEYRKNQTHSSE